MSDRQQDPELRARFAQLRRQDASRAPLFAEVMGRARAEVAHHAGVTHWRPLNTRRLGWATGLAAAAAIAALIVVPRAGSEEAEFEHAVRSFQSHPALGGWRSPTAGLLDLPGNRLMSTIPAIGVGPSSPDQ